MAQGNRRPSLSEGTEAGPQQNSSILERNGDTRITNGGNITIHVDPPGTSQGQHPGTIARGSEGVESNGSNQATTAASQDPPFSWRNRPEGVYPNAPGPGPGHTIGPGTTQSDLSNLSSTEPPINTAEKSLSTSDLDKEGGASETVPRHLEVASGSGEGILKGIGAGLRLPLPAVTHPKARPKSELTLLLENFIEADDSKSPFIPIDSQRKLLTKDAIIKELRTRAAGADTGLENFQERDICLYAQQIFEDVTEDDKSSSRRCIFGTLVLIDRSHLIFDFIRNGILDKDMPFDCRQMRSKNNNRRDEDFGPLRKISFMKSWDGNDQRAFADCQWYFLAPFFDMGGKVPHLKLRKETPLPFRQLFHQKDVIQGGFGQVSKVEIHPSHHNYQNQTGSTQAEGGLDSKQYFAVKRLIKQGDKQPLDDKAVFELEVRALKRFSHWNLPHLIRLLETYYHDGHYHFVFPWADGNLHEFWMVTEPQRNYEGLCWIAEQCHGLAEALKRLHDDDFESFMSRTEIEQYRDGPSSSSHLEVDDPAKIRARHGDIKPRNILWVREGSKTVLKLSDFGMTKFHRQLSCNEYETIPGSRTYRAPEFDLEQGVSPKYDMWALGCVFLEFVSWYVLGFKEGIDDFHEMRLQGDFEVIREDTFFNLVKKQNGLKGAQQKKCVREEPKRIEALYQSEHATTFILDFLQLVNNGLLRIRKKARKSSDKAEEELRQFHTGCKADLEYCTNISIKDLRRRKTNFSDHLDNEEVVSISENFEKRPAGVDASEVENAPNGYGVLRVDTLKTVDSAVNQNSDNSQSSAGTAAGEPRSGPSPHENHNQTTPIENHLDGLAEEGGRPQDAAVGIGKIERVSSDLAGIGESFQNQEIRMDANTHDGSLEVSILDNDVENRSEFSEYTSHPEVRPPVASDAQQHLSNNTQGERQPDVVETDTSPALTRSPTTIVLEPESEPGQEYAGTARSSESRAPPAANDSGTAHPDTTPPPAEQYPVHGGANVPIGNAPAVPDLLPTSEPRRNKFMSVWRFITCQKRNA